MTPKRNALGRGLDSLISMSEIRTDGSSAISEISVASISPNPNQPRSNFDDQALAELSASIAELGIIQPLSLRKTGDDEYQIIAGERRWRAAKMAGLKTVPAYVRTASDSEVTEMALIENIQREDLNAIEVALSFNKLIETYKLTQERLSERIGKSRATIANHLRLLKLPAEIQLGLRDRKLDMGHARALLSVADPKMQLKLYNRIVGEGLSVRNVEQLAREIADNPGGTLSADTKKAKKGNQNAAAEYDFFRRELEKHLQVPVKFARSAEGRGSITLKFNSDDELQRLVEFFEKIK